MSKFTADAMMLAKSKHAFNKILSGQKTASMQIKYVYNKLGKNGYKKKV